MKKIIYRNSLILILLLFCITSLKAQWVAQNSGTTNTLNDVCFTSPDTGYVVGNNGTIRKTINGGTTWTAQTSGTTNTLYNVCFVNAYTGYVVGEIGKILKTTNGGVNWSSQSSGTTSVLLSIFFINVDTGYVVGGNGLILKTSNGGTTWSVQTSGTTTYLYSVSFINVDTGYVVGGNGLILKTTNGGTTWTSQNSGITNFLESAYFSHVDTGYVVGGNGLILKTTNGGITWTAQNIGTTNYLYSVYFPNIDTGFVVGENGIIFQTNNGGTTWIAQSSSTTSTLYSVYFVNANTGYVIGNNGKILKTNTGGWCTGIPSIPSGVANICNPSSSYNYNTNGAPYATSYLWSINPSNAGSISGTGLTASVIWSTTYNGDAVVRVQGVKSGCTGESSSIGVSIANYDSNPFSLTSPSNGIWVSSTPLFQWNASFGTQRYTLYVDGIVKKDSIQSTSYQIQTNEAFTPGMHTWYVVANNPCTIVQSNETRSFLVDTTPPSLFNLISPIDSSWTTSTQPTLTWSSSSDAHSGFAKYQLWIDGVLNRDNISTSTTSTTPTNALSNGSHTWEIRAVDNVGNVRNSSNFYIINIDNIPPNISTGNCLSFDGNNDFVSIPHNSILNLSNNFTLESWVYLSNYVTYGSFITKGYTQSAYSLRQDNNGKLNINTGTSAGYSSNSQIPLNSWTHVAITYDGTNLRFYINGILDKTTAVQNFVQQNLQDLYIGADYPGALELFKGSISEIRIWGETRSQIDINNNKNIVLKGCEQNLIAYWRCNEVNSITLLDQSNNGLNGTINGATFKAFPPINNIYCKRFYGYGDAVRVLNSNSTYSITYNQTIEVWIKPIQGGTGNPRIISKQTDEGGVGEYSLYLDGIGNNRQICFWMNNYGDLWSTTHLKEEWYHIAVTISGNSNSWQVKLYINGQLENTVIRNGTIYTSSNILVFGRKGNGINNNDYYNGYISEVRMWNISRSQQELFQNQNKQINSNENGLIGYWKFNEGIGSIVNDYSINQLNGNSTLTANYYLFDQNDFIPISYKTCNLIVPFENQFTINTTPSFKWNKTIETGSGLNKYQLLVDCVLHKDNFIDTSWTITIPIGYGKHHYQVIGFDNLGNASYSDKRVFFVDNVSPNPFNLTSPASNQIVMFPTPNLSWQSTLDSTGGAGMKKYQLWINGVVNRDSIPVSSTTVSPSTVLPQGAYTWFIKAYDNVGNIRQSTETRVFYVDWEAPLPFELISPSDNLTLTTPTPTFIWHPSSDIGSGLDRYEITISGYQPITVLPTDTSYNLTFNLPNGSYSWFVKAYDHAGAFTSSNTNNFTINVPLPTQAATPIGVNEKCIGSQTTTYTTSGANYAENYSWSITPTNAGTITGTGLTGTVVWNATFSGVAQITVTGQNIVGSGITSSPFAVTVYPATIPGTISGSSTICLGQTTNTLTLSNYSGTILKWQKRINNSSWSDINNSNTTYFETPSTIGLHEYRVEVQNEICPSLFSSIASVTVETVPSNAGTISGPNTVCSNQYGVTYSITPISGALYYQWTLPNGATGVSTSNSINANFTTAAQSGIITVHGVNDCGDGIESTLAVSVNPLPDTAETISGNATVCQGENSVTYTVPTIEYANSYVWTLPSGVTGTSTSNTITVNFGTTAVSGNITVKGTNSCGNGVTSTKAITVNPLPAAAGTISGSSTVCQGQNSVTYTVPNITNATSYVWTLPNGAIGTSTTNSITVDYTTSAVSGNITVKGINDCGNGVTSTKAITVNPLPVDAGIITGNAIVCQGQNSVSYSVPIIANATSYVWTLPTGASGSSTTRTISVNYGTTSVSGNITVKGTNSCGNGITSIKEITVNPLPEAAGTISGNATVCQGENLVTYTVPDINNATSYLWTLPTGAVGTSTTNSITVNYGTSATSGNITVKGTNSCGNGVTSTKAITVNPLPATAGTISGSVNVCQGQNVVTYTVPTIANAITYIWTLPNGATGTSITNSITLDYSTSAVSGNITVKGTNGCGDGITSTKAITVYPLPDAAGIISGNATVCQGENSVIYSIPAITNATSYIWTIPNGATGTSTTNTITVNYGVNAISGNISVKGSNACGEGDISIKAITVKSRSTNLLTETVCDSYTAPDGQVYTTSGTKTAIIPNAVGCDSVITINLTINQSSSNTINETVCDTYTAPDGQIYSTSGTKTAIIPNAAGCDSTITINLTVNETPETPTINLNEDRLISSSLLGNQWYNQHGVIPNETNQELILTENGTYFVIVTQNNCPSDSSNLILVNNVKVQPFNNHFISLSPNPFTNQLTIKNQSSESYQYYMYNGIGQLILLGILENEVVLNTSDLAKGLYIIKFVNSIGQVYYKVIKQ